MAFKGSGATGCRISQTSLADKVSHILLVSICELRAKTLFRSLRPETQNATNGGQKMQHPVKIDGVVDNFSEDLVVYINGGSCSAIRKTTL